MKTVKKEFFKYYRLTDKQHNGLYVYQNEKGFFPVRSAEFQGKVYITTDNHNKFYMTPYFLRDTDVYDEYEEVFNGPKDSYPEKIRELRDKARSIAEEAHKGQVDKNGEPYIEHIERVADRLEFLEDQIIALLHDTLEDTDITEEDLSNEFPEYIVEAVKTLTRNKDEDYKDYIKRVALNDVVIKIKLADLFDNYHRPMKEPRPGLKERYAKAIEFLTDEYFERS